MQKRSRTTTLHDSNDNLSCCECWKLRKAQSRAGGWGRFCDSFRSPLCILNCDQFNILLAYIAVNKFYTSGNPLLYYLVLEILLIHDIVRDGTNYQRKEDDQEAKTYAARPGSRHSAPILFKNFRNIQLLPIAPQSSLTEVLSSAKGLQVVLTFFLALEAIIAVQQNRLCMHDFDNSHELNRGLINFTYHYLSSRHFSLERTH